MNSTQVKRVIAGVGAASLLATALAVPVAAAPAGGSSRSIVVSSTGYPAGTIFVTPVTAPGLAFFDVVVANQGRQTFTNSTLTIGSDFDGAALSDLPRPFGGGVTVESWSANGFTCESLENNTLLSCELGNLAARTVEGTVSVVLAVPSPTTLSVRAAVKGAERTNDGGSSSNVDTFIAQSGSQIVGETTCDYTATYSKAVGSAQKELATCLDLSTTNVQSTKIRIPGSLATGVVLGEGPCPTSFTCIGQESTADLITDTDSVLEWEIKVLLPAKPDLNKLVIAHYPDGSDTADLTLANARKNYCKNATQGSCIVDVTWSSSTNTLSVIYRTVGNGKTRLLG